MVSGAAPSNANKLVKDLSPVSGLLSTSGRGYKDPEVGSVPNTDFFSDSLVSWFLRMSSLVMVFLVAWSTASLNPVPLSRASQRTLPAREVINLGDEVPEQNLEVLAAAESLPCNPNPSLAPVVQATCDMMVAAAIFRLCLIEDSKVM